MVVRLVFVSLFLGQILFAQRSRFIIPNKEYSVLNFQLVNNLIIIPVEVNGVHLSFILDSGVSKPILFNIVDVGNTFMLKDSETIYLKGLGGGEAIKALKSENNVLKIGDAINVNQDLFMIFDHSINFTPRLGVNVHGIIGYDFLKDFVVEIKYSNKRLKFYNPVSYKYKKCRKCQTFDLHLRRNKPYLDAKVTIDSVPISVKLLMDTGSSDALWLFEDADLGIKPRKGFFFEDFLGKGLSGNIHGKRAKIDIFHLKEFELKNSNVAYPDSISISTAKKFKERNGSIGGEILKRFNLVIDYEQSKITFKKNSYYKKPFYYNKAGIILEQRGVRIVKRELRRRNSEIYGDVENNAINLTRTYNYDLVPSYEIIALRNNSPAIESGLELGDVILKVNGKDSHRYNLQEIMHEFYNKTGKQIRILIDRKGKKMWFKFKLKAPF